MNKQLDSWLWRINGFIILLLGLVLLVFVVSLIHVKYQRTDHQEETVKLADDPEGLEKWTLGRVRKIDGSPYLTVALVSENEGIEKPKMRIFSSGGILSANTHPAKNVLFINMQKNKASWLFKDTSQLILGINSFPFYEEPDADKPLRAKLILYTVISRDTNGDGVLNVKDKPSLAVSAVDGSDYHILANAIDRIIGREKVNNEIAILLYQNDGVAYSMILDMNSRKALSLENLPKVGEG